MAEYKCLGRLRMVHTHLPWSVLRVLFVGAFKCTSPGEGGGCWLSLLPVDGDKGLTSPLLNHIIAWLRNMCGAGISQL